MVFFFFFFLLRIFWKWKQILCVELIHSLKKGEKNNRGSVSKCWPERNIFAIGQLNFSKIKKKKKKE